MRNAPLISIIISNYNGSSFIKPCLDSILKSSLDKFEIVFIDDGSTDKSKLILQNYKKNRKIKILFSKKNHGPSTTRSKGVKIAKSKYLFFLDVDTEIQKHCLKQIVNYLKNNRKVGAIQAKLINKNDKQIETSGHFLTIIGFPYEVKNETKAIFGGRSAAFAVRKNVFDKIGGFDQDYLIYGEDTDLSWRIWLAGKEIHYLENALVFHTAKSSLNRKTKYRIFYQGAKNNINYITKNAFFPEIIYLLGLNITVWIFISIKLLFQGKYYYSYCIYKAFFWNIRNILHTLKKRRTLKNFKNKTLVRKIIYGNADFVSIFAKGLSWFGKI